MIWYRVEGSVPDCRHGAAFLYLPIIAFSYDLRSVLLCFLEQHLFDLCVAAFALDTVAETAFGRTCAV